MFNVICLMPFAAVGRVRQKYLFIILLVMAVAGTVGCCSLFWGKAPYDAKYLASEETEMWKAYYSKDKTKLAWHLVQVLRRQFGISAYEAAETGNLLADSALKFKAAKPGQYDAALPELTAAYSKVKKYSGLSFDPEAAAKADLAWWVDRRDPKRNDPKTIGEGITRLYEVIYGYRHPGFDRAGLLRAEAASLRDHGGDNCDWAKVEELLLLSYQSLKDGIDRIQQEDTRSNLEI
jgi:hypothetical protein